MDWWLVFVRIVHVLIGAGWLGSIYFSLTVLHPQSPELFDTREDFEEFIAGLSNGNRWRVLSAFCGTLLTGLVLVALSWSATHHEYWSVLIGLKALLLFLTFLIFVYVSWFLWARRVFALPSEYDMFVRQGNVFRTMMLILVGANMALGILAHSLPTP